MHPFSSSRSVQCASKELLGKRLFKPQKVPRRQSLSYPPFCSQLDRNPAACFRQPLTTMTIANSASNASLDAPPPYEQCVGEQLPSAPSPGLVLFNTEEQSDIVFTVGIDQEAINTHTAWRFPAHSFIVAEASPIFAEMIRTQVDPYRGIPGVKPEIRIHCPPEIFHILLR